MLGKSMKKLSPIRISQPKPRNRPAQRSNRQAATIFLETRMYKGSCFPRCKRWVRSKLEILVMQQTRLPSSWELPCPNQSLGYRTRFVNCSRSALYSCFGTSWSCWSWRPQRNRFDAAWRFGSPKQRDEEQQQQQQQQQQQEEEEEEEEQQEEEEEGQGAHSNLACPPTRSE